MSYSWADVRGKWQESSKVTSTEEQCLQIYLGLMKSRTSRRGKKEETQVLGAARHGLLAGAEPQPREGIAAPTGSMESLAVWGLALTAFIFLPGNSY